MIGDFPHPFPNGWFAVSHSDELAVGVQCRGSLSTRHDDLTSRFAIFADDHEPIPCFGVVIGVESLNFS